MRAGLIVSDNSSGDSAEKCSGYQGDYDSRLYFLTAEE